MNVALRVVGPIRQWHLRLRDRLQSAGHRLRLEQHGDIALPRGLSVLIAAERRIYGAKSTAFETVEPPSTIDALGDAELLIEAMFDAEPGESGLIKALLQRRAPTIEIQALRGDRWATISTGLPAIENPDILTRGLEHVLTRLVGLIVHTISIGTDRPINAISANKPHRPTPSPLGFLVASLFRKIRRLIPRRKRSDLWHVAFRKLSEPSIAALSDLDTFTILHDDGLRFNADPFVGKVDNDRHQVFFEELPYATQKGVIARVEIDAKGRPSLPRIVLEQPFHLSYPFVLSHEDKIFMLPETSAAHRVQLFRADPYPDRWIPDRILIEDVDANDATPILHEGKYWIFATLSGDGGSSWDQLGLFHAPDLFGPWTPHRANPVMIDAGAARPAGAMWHENGTLMRVAQDCRVGYGSGIVICRVDRLDLDGYGQTIVERIAPSTKSGAAGMHTFNRCNGLDVIDLR